MPAVEHLTCVRGSLAHTARIAGPPISTDDLDAGVGSQPLSQHLLVAAKEHIHRAMVLQIDQDGSCGMNLPKSPIVDAKHTRSGWRNFPGSTE
jgi:hypothetical protein